MKFENKLVKNIITSIITYGLSFGISFFLTPYITKTLGVEANGFVTLANQFVGYISLVTVALTSMASRFVSINIFQKDYDKANEYFSSVFIATVIMGIILAFPIGYMIFHIDTFINVSSHFVLDVKILLALAFFNFFIGLVLEVYTIATYVTNKLYLQSMRSIEGTMIRCIVIVLMYAIFPTKMYFVTLASMVNLLYTSWWNIHYTRTLLPDMRVRKCYFKWKAIKELIVAGSWNIVIQLNNILNTGLDLLLSNWFLGQDKMGILSVAKTIPVAISTMLNSVSGVFFPEMTQNYAIGDMKAFLETVKKSIKILGMIFNIPVVFLIVFGSDFYRLWQPNLNSKMLMLLSLLTIVTILVSGSTAAVFGIFTITNKLKFHSLTSMVGGVLNVVVVVLSLWVLPEEYGVYIVAGASTLIIIIRNYLVTFPYAAKCIKQKWYVFHIPSFMTILGAGISSLCAGLIKIVIVPTSWSVLMGCGVITAFICLGVNSLVVLKKEDRRYLINIIKSKIRR